MDDSTFEDDQPEEEAWDEFRWEEFMKEADKRTEKYGELWEKYQDDPDRDKKIVEEMGWTRLLEELESQADTSGSMDEEGEDEDEEGEEWKQHSDASSYDIDGFSHQPLFEKAHEYAISALNFVKTLPEDKNSDPCISQFIEGATVPAAKIAGGYVFGLERDSIGGNIANCKRGLHAANQGLSALLEMRQKGIVDTQKYLQLCRLGKEVRDDLALHIIDLRNRFESGLP